MRVALSELLRAARIEVRSVLVKITCKLKLALGMK